MTVIKYTLGFLIGAGVLFGMNNCIMAQDRQRQRSCELSCDPHKGRYSIGAEYCYCEEQ